VLAWVQPKIGQTATAEEIREFRKGKIAYFKIPQHVRFVEGFPITVSQKVQSFDVGAGNTGAGAEGGGVGEDGVGVEWAASARTPASLAGRAIQPRMNTD
jgi:hypothetical protein